MWIRRESKHCATPLSPSLTRCHPSPLPSPHTQPAYVMYDDSPIAKMQQVPGAAAAAVAAAAAARSRLCCRRHCCRSQSRHCCRRHCCRSPSRHCCRRACRRRRCHLCYFCLCCCCMQCSQRCRLQPLQRCRRHCATPTPLLRCLPSLQGFGTGQGARMLVVGDPIADEVCCFHLACVPCAPPWTHHLCLRCCCRGRCRSRSCCCGRAPAALRTCALASGGVPVWRYLTSLLLGGRFHSGCPPPLLASPAAPLCPLECAGGCVQGWSEDWPGAALQPGRHLVEQQDWSTGAGERERKEEREGRNRCARGSRREPGGGWD